MIKAVTFGTCFFAVIRLALDQPKVTQLQKIRLATVVVVNPQWLMTRLYHTVDKFDLYIAGVKRLFKKCGHRTE